MIQKNSPSINIYEVSLYLPYNVNVLSKYNTIYSLSLNNSMDYKQPKRDATSVVDNNMRLILYPISDLLKEENKYILTKLNLEETINSIPIDEIDFSKLQYHVVNYLISELFDVFKLIDRGVAVNIHEINKNNE